MLPIWISVNSPDVDGPEAPLQHDQRQSDQHHRRIDGQSDCKSDLVELLDGAEAVAPGQRLAGSRAFEGTLLWEIAWPEEKPIYMVTAIAPVTMICVATTATDRYSRAEP